MVYHEPATEMHQCASSH